MKHKTVLSALAQSETELKAARRAVSTADTKYQNAVQQLNKANDRLEVARKKFENAAQGVRAS